MAKETKHLHVFIRRVYVHVCVYVYGESLHSTVYAGVSACMGLHMCGGQRLTTYGLLSCYQPYFLRQGRLLKIWLAN